MKPQLRMVTGAKSLLVWYDLTGESMCYALGVGDLLVATGESSEWEFASSEGPAVRVITPDKGSGWVPLYDLSEVTVEL